MHFRTREVFKESKRNFAQPYFIKYGTPIVSESKWLDGVLNYEWSDGKTELEISTDSDKSKDDEGYLHRNIFYKDVQIKAEIEKA